MTKSSCYHGQPVQLAVIAAATDCGLGTCCRQMWNSGNIECSYIFTNRGDRAIRAARVTCRLSYGREFRSFEELAPLYREQLGKINIIDVTKVASRKHSVTRYTSIPIVKSCIRELVDSVVVDTDFRPASIDKSAVTAGRGYWSPIGTNVCTFR